jgi:uncharacterized membrane protein YqjE
MDNLFSKAEALAGNLKEYVNTRIESLKLNAAEKSSKIIANGVAAIVVVVFVLFFVALGSIALSLVVGIWIGKTWTGFLVVGVFYLLLSIVIWAARGRLIRMPVMNAIIQQLFRDDEKDQ